MKRILIRSNAFARAAKRLVKKNPRAAQDLQLTLVLLCEAPAALAERRAWRFLGL